jgi:hypothetical protein
MARKLLIMAALISLVLLFQATSGLADTYTLPGGNNLTSPSPWNETHGSSILENGNPVDIYDPIPGRVQGDFYGTYTGGTGSWTIGKGVNSDYGTWGDTFTDEYGSLWATLTIVYDDGDHSFVAQNSDGLNINSSNTVITTIASYKIDPDSGHLLNQNGFLCQDQTLTMLGTGTNIDGTLFTFTADLKEVFYNHDHSGYVENFEVVYGSADPAAAPIPGAVWLLGSGLLGLAGLRSRRKS